MEFLVATGIGMLFASGTYLLLRPRTFPVVVGLSLLAYGVNALIFATGRLTIAEPPILALDLPSYTDPLPQALVLTAIVIAFGMTAFAVVLILRSFLEVGSDHVDGRHADHAPPGPPAGWRTDEGVSSDEPTSPVQRDGEAQRGRS